jgi:hypothetical protein
MSTKHTPGPWEVRNEGSSRWIDIVQANTGEPWPLPFAACKHFDQEANARLIAAAPDLLEALVDLVAFYPLDSADANVTSARAAIAKATGQKGGA